MIGQNVSIEVCHVCGVKLGVIEGDVNLPPKVSMRRTCFLCKEHMKNGIVLISVDLEKTTDQENPWRTGAMVVIKSSEVRRIIKDDEQLATILDKRIAYVTDTIWDKLRLPRPAGPA